MNNKHIIEFYEDENPKAKKLEIWLNDRYQYHREDGPAYCSWSSNGQRLREVWYFDNKFHCLTGPAEVIFLSDSPWFVAWYVNGILHRTDGPAIIIYDSNGEENTKQYWYEGEDYSQIMPYIEKLGYKLPLSLEEKLHIRMIMD